MQEMCFTQNALLVITIALSALQNCYLKQKYAVSRHYKTSSEYVRILPISSTVDRKIIKKKNLKLNGSKRFNNIIFS